MQFHIRRIDQTLPIPEYQTEGAVAFDLIAREEVRIPAKGHGLVPNNVIVRIPEGYMLLIASRSSTLRKKGLIVGNGMGIIDQDFHGPEDELHTLFYNVTGEEVVVTRGERISQAVFVQIGKGELIEAEGAFKEESRGGWGTTGTH